MAEPTPSPVAETGAAARSASSSAAAFMRAKTFGMPRWVFLGLLAAGVGFGLWYRYRQGATAPEDSADPNVPDGGLDFGPDSLAANGDEPGLAGVGVAGVAPGSVVPVTTPTLPEGFPEAFTDVTGGLVDLASEFPSALEPPAVNITYTPPPMPKGAKPPKKKPPKKKPPKKKPKKRKVGATVAHAPTGGGPPVRRAAAHKPPKRKR